MNTTTSVIKQSSHDGHQQKGPLSENLMGQTKIAMVPPPPPPTAVWTDPFSSSLSRKRRERACEFPAKKRSSQRYSEQDFLEMCIKHGNEVEIAQIEKSLQDDPLVCTPDKSYGGRKTQGAEADQQGQQEPEHCRPRLLSDGPLGLASDGSRRSRGSSAGVARRSSVSVESLMGTTRRLELLNLHKNNSTRSSLWSTTSKRTSVKRLSIPQLFDKEDDDETSKTWLDDDDSSIPSRIDLTSPEVSTSTPRSSGVSQRLSIVSTLSRRRSSQLQLRGSQVSTDRNRLLSEDGFSSDDEEGEDQQLEQEEESVSSRELRFSKMRAKRASIGEGFEVGSFLDDLGSTFLIEPQQHSSSIKRSSSASKISTMVTKEDSVPKGRSTDDEDSVQDTHPPRLDPWTTGTVEEIPFLILGTSVQDEDANPHVLSPPLMESLQMHLPFTKQGQNLWLKYSLVRDGASAHTFLQRMKGSKHVILAMETLDGEVFGAYTSEPWLIQHGSFGNTGESFVWRMKSPRSSSKKNLTLKELIQSEREIDVFKYCRIENSQVTQLCRSDRIAVGGGTPPSPRHVQGDNDTMIMPYQFGFALSFESDIDMLEVTSSPCVTFDSPSLSKIHKDGSPMELVNLEAWTLTPFRNVKEAAAMESGRLFLRRHVTC